MATTLSQKIAIKTNAATLLMLFCALCAVASCWWATNATLSNIQTQKQHSLIQVHCENRVLNLSLGQGRAFDSKELIAGREKLQKIEKLNVLCADLTQAADSINSDIQSTLLTNNYIYTVAIIILLLTGGFIIRNNRDLPHDLIATDALDKHQKNNTKTTEAKADAAQHINSLDIAHKALIQLVEEIESTEPFTLVLNEMEKLINATSSAIYVTHNASSQLTLLTCTDLHDQDWSKAVPRKILPKASSFNAKNKIIEVFEKTVQPEYKFVCIGLNQESHDFSLLVLKLATKIEITDATIATLLEHATRLANIVSSVRLARLKLRHVQYEERAVIARELHDSLAQSLSYLKIQTSRLQNILTSSDIQAYSKSMEIDAMMQDLRSNLNIAYRHLRELISTFRLTMGGGNFSQALSASVEEFSKRSGIAFAIDNRLPTDILTVTEETQLLHIVRESLSNVVRHSQAKSSLISISYNEKGRITVVIEDDGIGMPDISNPEQHFGIIIMQERAHSINGNISLSDRPEGGARLKIVFQASKHISAH